MGLFYVFESNLLFFFIYESVFMVFVNLKRRVGEGIYKAEAPIGFTLLSLLRPKPQ